MRAAPPEGEAGMILINVLLIVALAASILALMMVSTDESLSRSLRLREAAQAMAIVHGGELSAVAALRRDADLDSDDSTEPWANIADRGARIDGGTFDLVVADAQDRYNLNALARGDVQSRATFAQMVAVLRLNRNVAIRVPALFVRVGEIRDLVALRQAGVSDPDIARLATLGTVLPGNPTVNVNSAPEALLAIMMGNAASARALVARRERSGRLAPEDFAALRTIVPIGADFTSDLFWVHARVMIGGTSQRRIALLQRRVSDDRPVVVPIARWKGAAAPFQAPPLP